MRVSYTSIALAITAASAAPIPSGYTWSFSQWTGGWYGIGWANFLLDAPAATSDGVTIPAISFTSQCHIANSGGETQNCNDVLAGGANGRSLEFTLRPFDASLREVQLDGVYKFSANGKNYALDAHISQPTGNGVRAATISPTNLREV